MAPPLTSSPLSSAAYGGKSPLKDLIEAERSSLHSSSTSKLPSDWGLPPDLKRMVVQEEREVKPHREETEVMNLGVGEERKEVKVGTCMSANVRDELVALL